MRINLLITGAVYNTQAAYTALRFAQQAVAKGHEISQVFFYQDGVSQANRLALPLADEFNAVDAWAEFADRHASSLVVCVSAAERRGVMGAEQAAEHGYSTSNLHPLFQVEGLGALHDASLQADRTVSFR